jgi:hypothetical protein
MKLTEQFRSRLQQLAGVKPLKPLPKSGGGGQDYMVVNLCVGEGEAISVDIYPEMAATEQQQEMIQSFIDVGAGFMGFCDEELTAYSTPMANAAIICSVLYQNDIFQGFFIENEYGGGTFGGGAPVGSYEIYSSFSSTLEEFENQMCSQSTFIIYGCNDPEANNYNPLADCCSQGLTDGPCNNNDYSCCEYVDDACVDSNINTFFNDCPGSQCGGFSTLEEFCFRCEMEYESTQTVAVEHGLPNCDCCPLS